MDARNVQWGETDINKLIQWLRQTNRPQTLEALTQRYVELLKASVGAQEES